MADLRTSDLPNNTTILDTDEIAVLVDPAGTPTSEKRTFAQIKGHILADPITITNATVDNTISVDQNGNVGTNVATDGAIHIENTGNTGIGLGVYTNIGATADSELVSIKADNAAFDRTVVAIVNDGVGSGIKITQAGITANSQEEGALAIVNTANNGFALAIYSDNGAGQVNHLVQFKTDNVDFDQNVLNIINDGVGNAIRVTQNGTTASAQDQAAVTIINTANNGLGLVVYSDNDAKQANALVQFKTDNVAFDQVVLAVSQDGVKQALSINATGGYAHMNFLGDPANTAAPADGDFWFNGTNLLLRVGTTTYTVSMV